MDVAVVGAGIHGLSVARRIAERGHRVVVFDPRPIGHALGSSHGPSRIVRRAYPDRFHTALMSEAYPLWNELQQASGTSLLHEVGLLSFGPSDGSYVAGLADALGSQGVSHRVLERSEVTQFELTAGERAVFVPEAGWVAADQAIRATHELADAAGAEFVPEAARDLDRFDRVAICAGPWVRSFWSEAPVQVSLQATAHLVTQLEGPVWIEDGPDLLYGFPTFGPGAKTGVHRAGPLVDPDEADRTPPEDMLEAIRGFAQRRLGLAEPELVAATGCLYSTTPNEQFRFHRPDERSVVVSACSGHGFKFGPWVGVKVAEMLLGPA